MSTQRTANVPNDVRTVLVEELMKEEAFLTKAAACLTTSRRVVSTLERRVAILRQTVEAYAEAGQQADG